MPNISPLLKQPKVYIPLLILFVLAVGVNVFIYSGGAAKLLKKYSSSSTLTPTITPRPIPHGKIGFTVGQSDKNVPQFSRGYLDPYDPKKNATQTITIAVRHGKPITKVSGLFRTDSFTTEIPFSLISGTNTSGEWQGTWPVTDTYLYVYQLVLTAQSGTDKPTSVTITFR